MASPARGAIVFAYAQKTQRTARGPRPDPGRVRRPAALEYAAQDPGLPLRPEAELRARRRHLPPGAARAAPSPARTASRARCSPPARYGCTASRRCSWTCARCATSTTWWRVFRRQGRWGAISKTNGIGLRWRDPVYGSLRELAMSYFHEYTNRRDHKTLREYSVPFDLRRVEPKVWVVGGEAGLAARLDRRRGARPAAAFPAGQCAPHESRPAARPVRAQGRRPAAIPASARLA